MHTPNSSQEVISNETAACLHPHYIGLIASGGTGPEWHHAPAHVAWQCYSMQQVTTIWATFAACTAVLLQYDPVKNRACTFGF